MVSTGISGSHDRAGDARRACAIASLTRWPRDGALHILQLGQQMARMLPNAGPPARPSASSHRRDGSASRAAKTRMRPSARQCVAQAAGIDAISAAISALDGVGGEQLAGIGPQFCTASSMRRWLSAVPSPRRTTHSRGMAQVVGHFLFRLGGDGGQRRVRRRHHRAPIGIGEGGIKELAERWSWRNRRWAARPAAGCDSRFRAADRRSRPRHGRALRPRPHKRRARAPGRSGRAPILASAISSSSIGAWPHHSDRRWPSISASSARRSA